MADATSQSLSVQVAHALIVKYNIQFSSLALIYFDYCLTWTREVKYFWLRKPNISTVLYFCCRYALVVNVLYAFAIGGKLKYMTFGCDAAYKLCSALSLLGRLGIMLVWGARTYAVFDRNKWILALFVSMGTVVFVLSILHVPYVTCHPSKGSPLGKARIYISIPSSNHCNLAIPPQLLALMTAVFEIIAALLTTFRILKTLETPAFSKRKTLMHVILEQGVLYIGFVSLFSTGAIILLNLKATNGTLLEKLLNALTIPVSGLMTCRFLIHLREWDNTSSALFTANGASVSAQFEFDEALTALEGNGYDSDEDSDSMSTGRDGLRDDPLFRVAGDRHAADEPFVLNRA